MSTHTAIDLVAFRAMFTEFVPTPDLVINAYFGAAGNYIGTDDVWDGLKDASLDYALQLMTAHLIKIGLEAGSDTSSGVVVSSGVADVSVSLMPPPAKDGWQFWLSSTPYGLQLWALLSVRAAGGWIIGGSPETRSFRKAGGCF
jgi:hypothetical protein